MATPYTDNLASEVDGLIDAIALDQPTAEAFRAKISDPGLTRAEDPARHICVMFVAYDPKRKEVLLGHHKKSDLLIFTGGHIEPGELLQDTLIRETGEEWGWDLAYDPERRPDLATLIDIENPRQTCKQHYDIWYFFPVDKDTAVFDYEKLAEEFHEIGWLDLATARKRANAATTHQALDYLEKHVF